MTFVETAHDELAVELERALVEAEHALCDQLLDHRLAPGSGVEGGREQAVERLASGVGQGPGRGA